MSMRPLRILITNKALSSRGGTQLYVRDLAAGLLKRGHSPIVYSLELGDAADELRAETVPVIDNLDLLGASPDLIHGNSNVETMTALLHFPNIPAVYVCHGWWSWYAAPPRFPRVLRYLAIDEACRDRMLFQSGIPQEKVQLVHNAVDLDRFRPRPCLPDRPARAVVFSNLASDLTYLDEVRRACDRAGLPLDVIGLASGNPLRNPESRLGEYDLVFAKGRSALEALAVGCAVVLCDVMGMGPMVKTAELERLRSLNFGARALGEPVKAGALLREINRYDARDAGEVSKRIRGVAGVDRLLDDLIALYQEVLEEGATLQNDPVAEERAAADFLRWMSLRLLEQSDSQRMIPLLGLANRMLRIPLVGPTIRWLAKAAAGRPRIEKRGERGT